MRRARGKVKGHVSQGRVLAQGRATARKVWHASQGVGSACIPRSIAAIDTIRTTTIKEVVQLCKLVVR